MKKTVIAFVMILSVLILSSCSAEILSIEDFNWKLRTVMVNNVETATDTDALVYAVGEADELYPDAKIVDVTLSAKNGILTVNDATNSKKYIGTYKVTHKTPKGTDYEVVIDGISGYATVAPTEYYNGTSQPTLPINLGEYSLYFIPND